MRAASLHVFILLSLVFSVQTTSLRIYYERCGYKGFTCPTKTDVVFTCNNITTWDVELHLWQFRAPTLISSLHIANCTSVKLNSKCTSEGRQIQQLRLSNITHLTIDSAYLGMSHFPSEVNFEDIQNIEEISQYTFLQIRRSNFLRYNCAVPRKDFESVIFKNVRIGTIDKDAFHNLTEMKNFTFENVSVEHIRAGAVQLVLTKNHTILISHSIIKTMEFSSFVVRGNSLNIYSSTITEMHSNAIDAILSNFIFFNNTIGRLHTGTLCITAHVVQIMDSTFEYIASGAFQCIGPGLPENSVRGFGQLKFVYEFRNNLIESLEVGSLHPDWRAYKNVGTVFNFSYNVIKCTCAELAWLGYKEGLGKEFSSLEDFHAMVLKKENSNICADAPCILPIDIVQQMIIKHGRCFHNITQEQMCDIYYPSTTTQKIVEPTKTTTFKTRFLNKTPIKAVLYQRSTKSQAGKKHVTELFFIIVFAAYFI